jgi:hypothetical protein
MALVNQKIPAELPEDCMNELNQIMQVVEVDQPLSRNWSQFLDTICVKEAPYKSTTRIIEHRHTYNGHFQTSIIRKPKIHRLFQEGNFFCRNASTKVNLVIDNCLNNFQIFDFSLILFYTLFITDLKPISQAKYKDVQHLKQFCSMEATNYIENLPYCEKKDKGKREQEELWFLLRRKKTKESGVQARKEK